MKQKHLNCDDKILASDVKTVLNKMNTFVQERKNNGVLVLMGHETINLLWDVIERYALIHKYPKETCPHCSAPYTTDDICDYCGGKLWE